MDFSYPETYEDIKSLTSQILQDFAVTDRLKDLEANGAYFDKTLWQKLQEAGLLSASLPESIGGMNLGYDATSLIAELIGQTMVSIPYISCIVSSALPLVSIKDNGIVDQALSSIASGNSLLTAAWIEPGNEDPMHPSARVATEGDGVIIDGIKHCIPFAADSDALLLSCIDSDNTLCLALVPTRQKTVELLAQRNTANEPQYQATFNQAKAHCIARGDAAREIIQQSIAMTTAAYCAMALGIADKMTRISAEYTSQREQFGVPLATFQAVAHKLANCYIDVECLRIITQKAVSDIHHGSYDNDTLSMAKAWCGDVLHRVSHAAQHVHGGMGIDKDYHLFRYCLWSKQLELSMGCSKIHIAKIADSIERQYLKG